MYIKVREEKEGILTFLKPEHQNLAPRAVGNLLAGMKIRQKCINYEIRDAFADIIHNMW